MYLAQNQCGVSSVVSWGRGVLLVGCVVLLVYYYESEIMVRQEERRPCAENYIIPFAALDISDPFCSVAFA